MVKRRKHTSHFFAKAMATGTLSLLVVACVGFGFASAGASNDKTLFGIGSTTVPTGEARTGIESDYPAEPAPVSAHLSEASALVTPASRDISSGIEVLDAELEQERIAAAEAARIAELEHIAAAQEAEAAQRARQSVPDLPAVDWTVGKDAFIAEWGARIDAYLSGSPLSGYGTTFAEAAWEYGVDPRFSPAISNTESTKGANCFRPYNAWGWMGPAQWSSWEQSIFDHVAGLSKGYGYTISPENASKYCPPTWQDWYGKTLNQMLLI